MQPHNQTYTLAPATPSLTLTEVYGELQTFFASPRKTLSDALTSFVLGGGTAVLSNPVSPLPVFRLSSMSGYHYSFQNKIVADIRFGITVSGYFAVQTRVLGNSPCFATHYYLADGSFAFSESELTQPIEDCGEILMETQCPILNHLYNILSVVYEDAKSGTSNTLRAHTIESFLRKIYRTRGGEMGISRGIFDPAVMNLTEKMSVVDLDPVLTWKERFAIIKGIKRDRATLLRTKRRAHHKSYILYQAPIHLHDFYSSTRRFFRRPYNNFLGVLDRICFDPLRWFFGVVRGNLGYSIALGIYSPFTFFFITQPMNPQAMWAVGKVRTAYIETTDKVKSLFNGGAIDGNSVSYYANNKTPVNGTVTALLAAPVIGGAVNAMVPSTQNQSTMPPLTSKLFGGQDNNYSKMIPSSGGILLSPDVYEVSAQTWEERMSNFKAMQISYEENLEIAPRFGRLEQMETQLNWPLIVESTWLETERYLDKLAIVERNAAEYTPAFLNYVASEKQRTYQVQLYLWDRNVRFILDHPYTMMDQSKEQSQLDYYVGRSFVLLKDMTQQLQAHNANLLLPKGYDVIEKLANHFQAEYKNGNSIFERLKNNSQLFAQKDAMDTKELRAYMKRQWEILYLLQNKTQEASNNGLQLYNWSIRNAVWITQSVFSAKRDELDVIEPLFKKNANLSAVNNPSVTKDVKRIDSQYEALFHMMVLEYTSIRKEIGENLKKDIEATQRRTMIGNMESFLKDRETLLKEVKVL